MLSFCRCSILQVCLHTFLLTWLGQHDLDAAFEKNEAGLGPIASALESGFYNRLVVLSNYDAEKSRLYCSWIEVMYPRVVTILYPVVLTSPTDYEEIYICLRRGSAAGRV